MVIVLNSKWKIDRETKFLENIKEETLSEMVFESIADKIEEEQYSSNEKI